MQWISRKFRRGPNNLEHRAVYRLRRDKWQHSAAFSIRFEVQHQQVKHKSKSKDLLLKNRQKVHEWNRVFGLTFSAVSCVRKTDGKQEGNLDESSEPFCFEKWFAQLLEFETGDGV